MKMIHFESIDSTSSYIKRNYKELEDYSFISSSFQSNGRGRNNRKWDSSNNNLLFSLLIKDENVVSKYNCLSLVCGVAIFNVLKNIKGVSIKWPNDIYVNDKKICGILLEGISYDNLLKAIVVGIGINVNEVDFDKYGLLNATSIRLETNEIIEIEMLKENVYKELMDQINKIKENDFSYLKIVKENNYLLNKEVYALYVNKIVKVKVIDINDDNTLKVLYQDKTINISSGEVTFSVKENNAY